jgi:serine/threonine protein phosphatase PrpC
MTEATSVAGPVCPSCGAPLLPGDRFCESCGHDLEDQSVPVTAVCAHCGATTQIVDGYCGDCGMKQPSPRDHIEQGWPGIGAVTDRGRSHHRNEDAMAVVVDETRIVAVVCDGTSTSVDSDRASQAAADAAAAVLAASDPDEPADPDIAAAFDAARTAVLAVPYSATPGLDPPSCTYLAAVIDDDEAIITGLGDCRSYWIDDAAAMLLTTDDSWAGEAVASGQMTMQQAMGLPQAHAITRWISADADPSWRPRVTRFPIPGPGRIVLCSDGLWNYALEPAVLAGRLQADALDSARSLVEFANDAGGHDNITVVVVDLPRPSPTEEKGAGTE